MSKKIIKKFKSAILISALALIIGYFGINVINDLFIWSAGIFPTNYQVNLAIENINSTNASSIVGSIAISKVNAIQQSLYAGFPPNLPITLPQFIGIELVLAGLYFTLDYISKQYNDE